MTFDNDHQAGEPGYAIVPAARLALNMWIFRGAVLLVAYVAALLCSWLIKGSSQPYVEALAPVVGLALGFVMSHLLETHRNKFRE